MQCEHLPKARPFGRHRAASLLVVDTWQDPPPVWRLTSGELVATTIPNSFSCSSTSFSLIAVSAACEIPSPAPLLTLIIAGDCTAFS